MNLHFRTSGRSPAMDFAFTVAVMAAAQEGPLDNPNQRASLPTDHQALAAKRKGIQNRPATV
jgi:hypothetical protein